MASKAIQTYAVNASHCFFYKKNHEPNAVMQYLGIETNLENQNRPMLDHRILKRKKNIPNSTALLPINKFCNFPAFPEKKLAQFAAIP